MAEALSILIVGLLLGGIYGLVAVGLNIIFGVVRVVNFAQGELVMIAMYATYLLYTYASINPYLAIFVVCPLLFLIGVAIYQFVLRPLQSEPNMQIFATFGLLIVFQNIALGLTSGRTNGIDWSFSREVVTIGSYNISATRIVALLALTCVTVGLQFFLSKTMVGKAVRAVIQDRGAARAMGIRVERAYALTFGAGAALAGLAGALLIPIYSVTPWIGGNFILAAFAVVVLGGLGSIWGAYLGGLVVGVVEAFAGFYIDPALRQAIWFSIFILVLVVRPSGLLGQAGAEEVGFREQR
jgi:branched-chain amino acid transport system permease protein